VCATLRLGDNARVAAIILWDRAAQRLVPPSQSRPCHFNEPASPMLTVLGNLGFLSKNSLLIANAAWAKGYGDSGAGDAVL